MALIGPDSEAALRRATPARVERPPAERLERLRRLAEWHAEWTARHADGAGFYPGSHPGSGDYSLHHVDLDASPEAQAEFADRAASIMGGGVASEGVSDG